MDELHFIPKAEAVARARKHLYRIGVLTPFLTEASFVQRIRGISDFLGPSEFELIIYTVKSPEQLNEYLDLFLIPGRLDGLIVLSILLNPTDRQRLVKTGLPTVFVEAGSEGFSAVVIDNERGGWLAADYLLTKGYLNGAFLGERSSLAFTLAATEQRLEGFRRRYLEAGIELNPQWIRIIELSTPRDYGWIDQWLRDFVDQSTGSRGLFLASDLLGAMVLQQARRLGLSVPGDLGVLGFDNLDMAEYLGLSTIDQELEASGRLAAELVQKKIRGTQEPVHRVFLNLSVIDRGSV